MSELKSAKKVARRLNDFWKKIILDCVLAVIVISIIVITAIMFKNAGFANVYTFDQYGDIASVTMTPLYYIVLALLIIVVIVLLAVRIRFIMTETNRLAIRLHNYTNMRSWRVKNY